MLWAILIQWSNLKIIKLKQSVSVYTYRNY